MRTLISGWAALLALAALLSTPAVVQAYAGVEAIEGRRYLLTKQHGPWMIMVAALKDRPGEGKTGLTAQQAADKLVFELRKAGIPAYTFALKSKIEDTNTIDRTGQPDTRIYASFRGGVAVLAGNYGDPDDENAQKTLKFIKKFEPRFMRDPKSGANFHPTKGQPAPLSGAILTTNPLLSAEEVRQRRRDPLLLKLNSGSEHSLLDNPGKYSLVVASFYGKSVTVNNQQADKGEDLLKIGDSLDQAGMDAWQLATSLRKRGYEAYVYHDRFRSVVTIGAFDSANDPLILKYRQDFGAKLRDFNGKQFLTAEVLTLEDPQKKPNDNKTPPLRTWIFDPTPSLIEVPHW